jgi:uncharacterized repeat protein (TIGR01451 family)
MWLGTSATPVLAGPEPVQVYFVPLPEEQIRTSCATIVSSGDTIHTVISISTSLDNTLIYYDHWEDGFEADLANPVQGSTETWGDGSAANGAPPGCALDACDVINAGDILVAENDVFANPRNPATVLYDGGDKIGTTQNIAFSRAGWPTTEGTLFGGAVEVFDTSKWGLLFELPAGQDSPGGNTFEYTGFAVMASEDGTALEIDSDGNGSIDITWTLDQGESYLVDGGVMLGATITASKPVQVDVITGDVGATYASRWFTLVPFEQWTDSYYNPVGTVVADDPSTTVIYNPNTAVITVTYESLTGTGTFDVPAGGIFEFQMPTNSGAHFYTTDSSTFSAICAVDYHGTTHDWGFTLLPEDALTTSALVGWGPGTSDLTANGSPVWLTAVADTTVYVDYDGDPSTGPLTDPRGDNYDVAYSVTALESLRVFDNTDNNQTGMRLYTLDGNKITAAWGQDPATAGAASPYFDLGTTVLPLASVLAEKTGSLANDINGNGLVDPGDTLLFVITFHNTGTQDLTDVVVTDQMDPNASYVNDSMELDGVPYGDDPVPPALTPFPLDEDGITIATLSAGSIVTITYEAMVADPLPPDTATITNLVRVDTGIETFIDSVIEPVYTGPTLSKLASPEWPDGVRPGEPIVYTMGLVYEGSILLENAEVIDIVPDDTFYAPDSANAGGTYDGGSETITWDLGSNSADIPGTVEGDALCPGSIQLTSDADTYIFAKASESNSNYGDEQTARTASKAAEQKYALLHFDVDGSTLPAGAVLQSATLLVVNENSNVNRNVSVHEVLTAWTEGNGTDNSGATWNYPVAGTSIPWAGGGSFSASDYGPNSLGTIVPYSNDVTHSVDVTSAVQNWISGTNSGLVLRGFGTDTKDIEWYAREHGTTDFRPQLVINYLVPKVGGCSGIDTFAPAADTWIDEKDSDNNRGNESGLIINPKPAERSHSLVRFDLTGIPSGAVINSATLAVEVQTEKDNTASVHRMLTSWTEGYGDDYSGASWDYPVSGTTTRWAGGGAFSSSDYEVASYGSIDNSTQEVKTVNITGLVDAWVNGGAANYGMILLAGGTEQADARYYSRDEGDSSRWPQLTINWSLPADIGSQTELSASPLLVTDSGQITVTMEVTVSGNISAVDVTPPASLTASTTNGAGATYWSGPTPTGPEMIPIGGGMVSFEYVYDVTAGANPGSVTFNGVASTTNPDASFASAESNSVLVIPYLGYQVYVDNPLDPAVTEITNVATFSNDRNFGGSNSVNSNPSLTGVRAPTAIDLLSFSATGHDNSVQIGWETAQEIDNLGFYVYRAPAPQGPFTRLTDKLIPALTFSVAGKSYTYLDTDVSLGKLYYYRLEDIDIHGERTFHGPICVDWDADGMPDDWEIANGLDPTADDAETDADFDRLTNLEEYWRGSFPLKSDTDDDGMLDGWEVANGLNPLVNDAAGDTDNDGLDNLGEFALGTHPQNPDSDNDLIPDGWEAENGLNAMIDDAAFDPDGDLLTNLDEFENGTDPLVWDSLTESVETSISIVPTSLSSSSRPGNDAPIQTFEIWNSGVGALSYNIACDAEWLSCEQVSGTSTGEHDPITVEYFTSSLSVGLYNATIAISDDNADNSPLQIPVSLTISGKSPIYRFWSANNRSHFYTMSESEKYNLTVTYSEDEWKFERIAWFAYSAEDAPSEAKPVYRFWSSKNRVHFYTMSESEKDNIIATYPEDVWKYERIACYAYAPGEQPEGAKPVYRFWSPKNRGHFYTISESEKSNVIANYPEEVWRYERIAWYAFDVP